MTKEALEKKTVKELRDIAKEKNIVGRWDMTKGNLVKSILEADSVSNNEDCSAKEEKKIVNKTVKETKEEVKESKNETSVSFNKEDRLQYVYNMPIGTIVAFTDGKKVRSAKVVKRSCSKRRLKLETKSGQEYIISFDDVIWVKTGQRWPRGVYNLFAGGNKNGTKKEKTIVG